jgi:hypothetical protein
MQHDRLLSDVHTAKGTKHFAVFVLTQLVEDIHQPLHGADHENQRAIRSRSSVLMAAG